MMRNLRVGLEVRPPVVVKKNSPRKREGGEKTVPRQPFSFPNISENRATTVNQTVCHARKSQLIFGDQWFKNGDKHNFPHLPTSSASFRFSGVKTLTAIIYPGETKQWLVAYNSETGTTSQGKKVKEALKNLKEATSLFLEEKSK